ncbi:protein tyrosine phosphatase [Xylanimonas cellulosilytica DSM 15894]|uniref:protein-tyrosine-phosphatase n=1 Tax=Xylanimonas cellulosilytica (strain DSM 15894 / JCM 12276 / CECT 5975 / KCTC 9989 / LMG 20990 / NBRC 107835 / XIL07) TaxID=446471 RepID=D1BTD3_XYLCX|nr:low molecular weight protein-tyrosine-phosphatase [Xylanimonas cellulosilytica]ACZ29075.1 protein tyrosine phosphatase [Xylanimonas cellulosilytica DSM 15894]
MTVPYRVMIVCTGNICRSPMAEIVLREAFAAGGLDGAVVVDSTGVSGEEQGNPVDDRARRVLTAFGYPGGDAHTARRVASSELAERDLVLAMTAHHARALRRLAGSEPAGELSAPAADGPEIRMFRSFDPEAPVLSDGDGEHLLDVEDPWYGGADDFEVCLREIEAATPGIVAYVRDRLAAR